MNDLIEAFGIFSKYVKKDSYEYEYPTNCSHDELSVSVDPAVVSEEDIKKLEDLGFETDEEEERFYSFRFGSN